MITPPAILRTEPLQAAALHVTVAREAIQDVMGPALHEVFGAIQAQGLVPSGPWFTHHHRRPTDTFDFDVCVPVSGAFATAGNVRPVEWPAQRAARTIHTGGYEGLAEAWGEFMDWLEANGHRRTDDLWERYLTGPETTSDASQWRTELTQPLHSA